MRASKHIVQMLTGEGPVAQALRESGIAEEIACFLTQQRGQSAERALNFSSQAAQGQRLTDTLANFVVNLLTTGGFLAGHRQGQQAITRFGYGCLCIFPRARARARAAQSLPMLWRPRHRLRGTQGIVANWLNIKGRLNRLAIRSATCSFMATNVRTKARPVQNHT